MDNDKRKLKGSERRDVFKRMHKELEGGLYATDADFCLVSKWPPGTVAYLDYKTPWERVTFSECIQYNEWIRLAPVYIVVSACPERGPFVIKRYLGGDWRPEPPAVRLEFEARCQGWQELGAWERELRREYRKRGGWNGDLGMMPASRRLGKRGSQWQ